MKHATSPALAELWELLDQIRIREGLREKKLGVFIENQNPFSISMRTRQGYLPISVRGRILIATR
jgi:hypothetical protein